MLEYALLLLLTCQIELPYEAETWPLDEAVVEQVEVAALRGYSRDRGIRSAIIYEQKSMLGAEMILIGTFLGDGPPAAGQYGPCSTLLFRAERCLKGACPDTVSLHWSPSAARGFFNTLLGTRPIDWSVPEPGSRHLLLGRASEEEPEFLWGGVGHDRYELRDGVVVVKGVPESVFLAVVEDLVNAAADSGGGAHESEGAAVQPPN